MLADSSSSCTRRAGHLVVQESSFPCVVLGTMETTDLLFLGSNEERVTHRPSEYRERAVAGSLALLTTFNNTEVWLEN